MNESYTWQKYYKILTEEQLQISGLRLFGHNSRNDAMQPLRLHSHGSCMEITFLIRGMQIYSLGGKNYPFFGSNAFVSFPQELHDSSGHPRYVSEFFWVQIDMSCEKDFLGLSDDFADNLKSRLRLLQHRIIPFEHRFSKTILKSFYLLASNNPQDKQYGNILLIGVLFHLIESDGAGAIQPSSGILDAMDYINKNSSESISLDLLAKMSNLSLSRFKERFQCETGISPREYINSLKIEEAKHILLENHSITETAFKLGFSSSNYFSSVFKKHTAMTPSEYLKEHFCV